MDVDELPSVFTCGGENLIGILHRPAGHAKRAVLIIVGGPQTRVGSHRQFVLLARDLANHGMPALRFDYRGMGDSEGVQRDFEDISLDIAAAIDLLWAEIPELDEVVLWGLCDAASAAMMYAAQDARVSGIVILNPWARSETGEARAYLTHYYASRFLGAEFWKKLFSGKIDVIGGARSLTSNIRRAFFAADDSRDHETAPEIARMSFQDRMLEGLERFSGQVLLITSGSDLTAAEFGALANSSRRWRQGLSGKRVQRQCISEANHTFSRREWREQVSDWCTEWLRSW